MSELVEKTPRERKHIRAWFLSLWYHTIRGHVLGPAERLKENRYRFACSCGGETFVYASRYYGISFVEESTCAYGLAFKRLDDGALPRARMVQR